MDLSEIEKFRDPIFRTSNLYSIRERGGKVIPFRPRPQQWQVLHMIYRRGLKRINESLFSRRARSGSRRCWAPVPGWMIANDKGGDFCQIGVRTKCSYKPPPMAAAIEKQRRTNDQRTTYGFISLTAPRMCTPVHPRSLRIAWAWYSPAFGAA